MQDIERPAHANAHVDCLRCDIKQESFGFSADPAPTSISHDPPICSPNLGAAPADPYYDNPSYSILNSGNFSQSPSLTLTILLEAWPINGYPYAVQLPSGSVLVIAGITPPHTLQHTLLCPCSPGYACLV